MDSNQELKPLTVMLSEHKLHRLEELAQLRKTTVPELAHSIIQIWLMKEYPPKTPEEHDREARDGLRDIGRSLAELIRVLWRRFVHSLK